MATQTVQPDRAAPPQEWREWISAPEQAEEQWRRLQVACESGVDIGALVRKGDS